MGVIEMKFDPVHVKCRDVNHAAEYYEKIFGARVISREALAGTPLVRLALGGLVLNLSGLGREEKLPEPSAREKLWAKSGVGHFGVLVEDLDRTVKDMKAKGAEFFWEPREVAPGTHVAFVKGPEEDVIEIIQRDRPIKI